MNVIAIPITLREANEFVGNFHRHNKPVQGARLPSGQASRTNWLALPSSAGRWRETFRTA